MTVVKRLETSPHVRKVLIVDDQPNMRRLIRIMLAAIGVSAIQEASGGEAGLELLWEVRSPTSYCWTGTCPHGRLEFASGFVLQREVQSQRF